MGRFRGTPVSSGVRTLALALASVGMVAGVQLAQAATIGHARLVSGPGEPLRIVVPVHELPASEAETLRVSIPAGPDWAAAGLSPPVALDSLGFDIGPGFAPETRLITLRSNQPFSASVVDLLIDVSSASGRQRHQVSLLAPVGASVSPPATVSAGGDDAQGRQVRVREGDNLFGIARRNAVPGVSVYQMMVGLYQQNPSAFIQKNLNLVRAGASLRVPDRATLTAISDREARRIFEQHARAFALYRNRLAATPDVVAAPSPEQAASGRVQPEPAAAPASVAEQSPSDRLRLSGAASGAATDNGQPGSGTGSPSAAAGQARAADTATTSPAGASSGQGGASGREATSNGVGNGTVMGNAQAATPPYPGAADDDRVASERALGDARSRVTELEGTVRELRDALADITGAGSSGSAAVPATQAPAASSVPAASASPASAPAGAAAASGTVEAAKAGSDAGEPETAGGTGQNGASVNGAGSVSPGSGQAVASGAEGAGAGAAVANDGRQVPASGGGNGGANTSTAASGSTATGNGQPASASSSALAPQQGAPGAASGNAPAAPATGGTTAGSNASGSNVADPAATGQGTETDTRARQVAEPITEKAEKTVSWLQENLIAIGGGVLALIVLFVLWLLRRSGKPADDGENAITEAMIREKLEKIDLDLSSSSDAGNSRER